MPEADISNKLMYPNTCAHYTQEVQKLNDSEGRKGITPSCLPLSQKQHAPSDPDLLAAEIVYIDAIAHKSC